MAAVAAAAAAAAQTPTGFLDRTLTHAGVEYRYQVYVPADYDATRRWPVILFLHGAGERGSDGLRQTQVGLGSAIRMSPDRWPAIVVMPQAPRETWWQAAPADAALAALDRTMGEFSTDAERVYLTGLSMGGNGSWYLAWREPSRWAAVAVVCGFVGGLRGFPSFVPAGEGDAYAAVAARMKDLPVRIWHGAVDPVVPAEESRRMAAALAAAGADVAYTELPGVDHNAWDPAYRSAELPEWLFAQRRTGATAAASGPGAAAFEVPARRGAHWYRGNTHAHTTESDGDSPPEVVARWYKDHGYTFLVLSDHNVWTDPSKLSHLVDSTFLLIPGEEVSARFEQRPVHVNGLNVPHVIEPRSDSTLVGTIQKNVDAVREVEGVPHINHPNFNWAIDAETLARIERDRLIEIHNGHPLVHNHGGGGTPGMEEVWDYLLTRGKRIYGIAVDDAHHFQGEFAADRANPGRGWVAVNADRLDARELLGAMEEGRFYASTGVALEDVAIAAARLTVRIRQYRDFRYTTTFLGDGGRVLATVPGTEATFELNGSGDVTAGLTYVRAKVVDSGGQVAWVQPVFLAGRGTRR